MAVAANGKILNNIKGECRKGEFLLPCFQGDPNEQASQVNSTTSQSRRKAQTKIL